MATQRGERGCAVELPRQVRSSKAWLWLPGACALVGLATAPTAWLLARLQPHEAPLPLLGPLMGVAVVLGLRLGAAAWPFAPAAGLGLAGLLGHGWVGGLLVGAAYAVGSAAIERLIRQAPVRGGCPGLLGTERFLVTLMLGLAVSPLLGALGLSVSGAVSWSSFGSTALGWWAGDALGAGLIVCATLSFDATARERLRSTRVLLASLGIWALAAGTTSFAFLGGGSVPLMCALPVILVAAAAHLGRFVSSFGALISISIAVLATTSGEGPLVDQPFSSLWFFAVTTLVLQALMAAATSDRRLGRAALEDSELRNQDLIEAGSEGVALLDSEGVIQELNEAACTALILRPGEGIGARLERFDPSWKNRFDTWRPSVETSYETRLRRSDGSSFPARVTVSSLHLNQESGLVATFEDLTEQVETKQALCEHEARLRAIYENVPECVKVVSRSGALLDMNPAGLAMINAESLEEVRGEAVTRLVHPEDREGYLRDLDTVFSGQPVLSAFRITGLQGQERWMEQHAVPLFSQEAPGQVLHALAVTRDITERKLAEEKGLHRQRLEALGSLAGGIAHDLNNLLAPAVLAVDELREVEGLDPLLSTTLDTSLQRASDTVRQLLSFSKGLEGDPEPVALPSILGELERILRATLPKEIELQVEPLAERAVLLVDETQLQQVLLNLSVNARDAMAGGGRLTVRSEVVEDSPGGEECPPGRFLRISVIDTGCGIPPELQTRILEPFFTTKGPDKGTGLGLSSAVGIMARHGGFLTIDSEVGRGSTFAVHLPMYEGGDPIVHEASPPASSRVGEAQLALVIDDERAIRLVTERCLKRLGFEVLTAASGEEAREVLAARAASLSLVLSDLRMPDVRGTELLREAGQLAPEAGLILATGLLDTQAEDELDQIPGLVRLDKPYGATELAAALEAAIDRKSALRA